MTWLDRTPSAVLDACTAMIPRLVADEARGEAEVMGVGRSFKPGSWAKRRLTDWNRTAEGSRFVQKAPSVRDLQGIGIGLRGVK